MLKYKKVTIPKALKEQVWKLSNGISLEGFCYVCKNKLYFNNFEAGHIEAEVKGGDTSINNLRAVCKPCNRSCSSKNMEAFKQILLPVVDDKQKLLVLVNNTQKNIVVQESLIKEITSFIVQQEEIIRTKSNIFGSTSCNTVQETDKLIKKLNISKEKDKLDSLKSRLVKEENILNIMKQSYVKEKEKLDNLNSGCCSMELD